MDRGVLGIVMGVVGMDRGVLGIVMGVVGMDRGVLGIVIMACRDRWEAGFLC